MIGDIKAAREVCLLEQKVNDAFALQEHKQNLPHVYDFLEGMAGVANASRLAPTYGLKPMMPMDKQFGWDISIPEGKRQWDAAIEFGKPMVLLWGFRCTEWIWFNRFVNYKNDPQELEQRQDTMRPMVKTLASSALKQSRGHRYFLFEQPVGSNLDQQPEFAPILSIPGVMSGVCHGCACGVVHPVSHKPLRKRWRFYTNHPILLNAVTKFQCCHGPGEHDVVEGANDE